MRERFLNRPEHYYSPDKLVVSYGVPAPTAAFVYDALGKRKMPTKEEVISDTVESIAARYNLRYTEQKLLRATAALVSEDLRSFEEFDNEQYADLFNRSMYHRLGGTAAIAKWHDFRQVFESLRQSPLIQATRQAFRIGQ
jgi:hypothetical protein